MAEQDILMQQRQQDGSYNQLYPITKASNVNYINSVFNDNVDNVKESLDILASSILIKQEADINLPAKASNSRWVKVYYGGGKFIVLPQNSNLGAYSIDGVYWQNFTLPVSQTWVDVAYGNGYYIAIGTNSSDFAYSTDGVTWKSLNSPGLGAWNSIAYGNGKFIVVRQGTWAYLTISDINVTWTDISNTPQPSLTWSSITYGNGIFVAIAKNSNYVAYSSDGINWSTSDIGATENWAQITYGEGRFLTVGYVSNTYSFSNNGSEWVVGSLPSTNNWRSITYGNGTFVVISYNDDAMCYSTDGGTTWNEGTLPSSGAWYSVAYGGNKYIIINYTFSELVAYSTNGITWSTNGATLINPNNNNITNNIYNILGLPNLNDISFSAGVQIETGSYVGTGTYGESNPNSLTFGFEPKLVIVNQEYGLQSSDFYWGGSFIYTPGTTSTKVNGNGSSNTVYVSISGNSISWYNTVIASTQLNNAGTTYYYTALG